METRKPDASQLTPKKRSPPKQPQLTLEKAMQVLLEKGFKIQPPDLEEEAAKQDAAASSLGVIKHEAFKPKQQLGPKAKRQPMQITLAFPHSINGVVYGPGLVTVKDASLLESLAHKDTVSKEQEARTFESVSRCHIIVNKTDAFGRQNAFAQQVDASLFNSPAGILGGQIYREFSSSDIPRS